MGIIKRNYFKMGDHNGICDISGQKYKFSELKLNWRGLWVSPSQFEPKETQLTIRPRMEKISVNDARTDPEPVFAVGVAEDLTTQ